MVPSIVLGPARYPGRHPFLVDVVIDVPLVSAGNAAFVTPDERLSACELIYVEFQRLRIGDILSVKINVVNEVVKIRNQRVLVIR